MEVLPHALDKVLEAHAPEPLPAIRALTLAAGIADGLTAIHAAGFIHRDVKPSNVLLRADSTPALADLGQLLARSESLTGSLTGARLTGPNVVVGMAEYISSEQVLGYELDARSDVYSLGVVL